MARRTPHSRRSAGEKTSVSRMALGFAIFCLGGAVMTLAAGYLRLARDIPPIVGLLEVKLEEPMRVYTKDREFIGQFGTIKRTPRASEDVPLRLRQAILAAEDHNFYNHEGVSYVGLARAVMELLRYRTIRSGGGTITMQVARNYLLSREQTFVRKFREIILAYRIDEAYTKDEVMSLYLNNIFLGNRAYGVVAGAQVLYGKTLEELTLDEIAVLAALPKAPSSLNPVRYPARAQVRRDWVLRRMRGLGYISNEDYELAVAAPVTSRVFGYAAEIDASHAAEIIRRRMLQLFGRAAYTEGYQVITTIDSQAQSAAVHALRSGLENYDRRHGWRLPAQRSDLFVPRLRRAIEAGDYRRLYDHAEYNEEGELLDDGGPFAVLFEGLLDEVSYGDTIPALVLKVEGPTAQLAAQNEGIVDVEWGTHFNWMRQHLGLDRLGARPRSFLDVIKPGQVIYLRANGDTYDIVQSPNVEGALVALDPTDGAIVAMVGGYDAKRSEFNRATQAKPLVGSSIKPFLYSEAVDQCYSPATVINESAIVIDDDTLEERWQPANSDGRFYGETSLRDAIVFSRNLVSIKLLQELSIDSVIDHLKQFGFIESDMPRDLSLSLGTAQISPLDLARGFSVFANNGILVQPQLIWEVIDRTGARVPGVGLAHVIETLARPVTPAPVVETVGWEEITGAKRVISQAESWIIADMMKDAATRGTGRGTRVLKRDDIAGKTGTSNDADSTWFSGFTKRLAASVWVGYDSPQTLGSREFGSTTALPIWIEFAESALQISDARESAGIVPLTDSEQIPEGIALIRVDPETGLPAVAGSDSNSFEYGLNRCLADISTDPTGREIEDVKIDLEEIF